MISRSAARRLTATVTGGLLVLTLGSTATADHADPPGPTNAQTTYGWGKPQWQDGFIGPRKELWRVAGRGNVRTQHGMLTLNTARTGSTRATSMRRGQETGRWEVRLRSRRYETTGANYRVRTELVPADGERRHCGARNVALETYRLGGSRARLYIRNRPDLSFTSQTRLGLGNDRWHTYAVEVTRKRISWFVDAHVIATERRTAALSGVPFTVRFTMLAQRGERMNRSRMQMDWLRYFTMEKPNDRSVDAPRATRKTYRDAC